MEQDPEATPSDRRAVRDLFNWSVTCAVDWRAVVSEMRAAVRRGENAFDLPLCTETMAEILLAGLDRRPPGFVVRENGSPVAVTQLEVSAITLSPQILTPERFTAAAAKHLTASLEEFASLDVLWGRMSDEDVVKYVNDALEVEVGDLPLADARPYFVAFRGGDDEFWRVARQAQRDSGLSNLRLVRMARTATWNESAIVQLVKHIIARGNRPE